MMPSPSSTKAALRATAGSPRNSWTMPRARTALPVQSERRGTSMSSACCHATWDQGLSREIPYGVTPVASRASRRAFSSESSLVHVLDQSKR
jgi:hypothetical protein